ncbi:MAG TPA: hypothetical protein VMW76_00470 [Bacteroidales bacterium]|nr:hypothetical protein [Bacteroidales bacterium]
MVDENPDTGLFVQKIIPHYQLEGITADEIEEGYRILNIHAK